MTEPEAKALLSAYGIPVVETHIAETPREAGESAETPVALKILSRDISHKSDVGGVALNLSDANTVERAPRACGDDRARSRTRSRKASRFRKWPNGRTLTN